MDKGADLWIGGDFNLLDINWDEETVVQYDISASVSNSERLVLGLDDNAAYQDY